MGTNETGAVRSVPADIIEGLAHVSDADVAAVDAWWRANNYLTVGQISVPTPRSIREGGELGYVPVHAFDAVMDTAGLIALAVVGDSEAETAPLGGRATGSRS